MYLNAAPDEMLSLPSVRLTREFRADFVFDKAYPKRTFETQVSEYIVQGADEGHQEDFDPVMWYCVQDNDGYCSVKWWDTPNGNNCDIWFGNYNCPAKMKECEKEIFPYNTPIKCEEQIIGPGIGRSKLRKFWLKKVVLEERLKNGTIRYTSCMAEGKKKYGIYKIKKEDRFGDNSGWVITTKPGDSKYDKILLDFILKQGIDMLKNVKNVYSEIQPDGKIR